MNNWQKSWPGIVVGLAVAVILARVYFLPTADPSLAAAVGQKVNFTGVITTEPDRRDNSTLLSVKPENSSSQILVTMPAYGNWQYGEEVAATGTLKWPENFANQNGSIFNYQKYLEKDGIFFVMSRPELKPTGRNLGQPLLAGLFKIKNAFVTQFQQLLPEPESSLLAGLLVGEKQALGTAWSNRFRLVGLSHIVVLSGFNLSLVANYSLKLFGLFLPRGLSLAAGALGILLFAAMVGGGATVLRASLMALIALLARATGRVYHATIALAVAGALMLIWNPLLLFYDLGFQLSFLATLGVIHGPPLLAPYFHRLTDRWGIKDIILTTVSAQIIVLPLILYATGNFSVVALPANLLVLSFIPATMLAGFLMALAGFVSPVLAFPLALLAHVLLAYILLVVKILAGLPLAAFTLQQFPLALAIILYAAVFYLVWKLKKPAPLRARAGSRESAKENFISHQ